MKIHRLLFFGALLLQTNLFALQSDTLNLDEIMLKSALINQANPALTVSEISYGEYGIKAVNFKMQLIFLLDFGLQIVKIKRKITEWQLGVLVLVQLLESGA